MNESEERLQELLERLEAGEPLATCLEGLPPEEAEILTLAATLQEAAYPTLDSETAVTQRASLQRAVIQKPQPNVASIGIIGRSIIGRLINWWQAQTAAQRGMLATVSATALVIMLVVVNLDSPFNTDEITGDIDQIVAQIPVVDSDRPSETEIIAEDNGSAAVEIAAPEVEDPGNVIFIPAVSAPMDIRPQTAVLETIQGVVEMQTEEGEWTAVTHDTTLSTGQRVRTAALSQASLTFFDGSQAHLGPETEISLDQVDAQLPGDGFRTVVMTQWLGQSKHDVQFRHDSGSRYEVKTPNGTGIARGTVFDVYVTDDLRAQYAVTEGRVDVTGASATVSVTAGQISDIPAGEEPSQPTFRVTGEGEVSQIGDEWIIGGQTFLTNEYTQISGDPQVGDWVRVKGHLLPDGSRMADYIALLDRDDTNRFELTGVVESIGDEGWVIAGQDIAINADTLIEADIVVGSRVRVRGLIQDGGILLAENIRLLDTEPGLPFEFTGVVEAMGDSWIISGVTITTDADTEIEDEIVVGDLVKVEGWILEDGSWLAHEIKLAEVDENRFEITGPVGSMDPWMVAGIPFETREWTEIEEGIVVGDLVKVEGIIMEDGVWVAQEIKLLDEDDHLTFEFYGVVDSMAPWSVSGIPLDVTEDTAVDEGIAVGDLVKVTVTILPDGSWTVDQITLINDGGDDEGCFSVTAVIVSMSDDQLTVDGWPVFQLGDDVEIDGLKPGSVIVIYACVGDDGVLTVLDIIILYEPPTLPPVDTPPPSDGGGKVTLCHNTEHNPHTITVDQAAMQAHLNHGDTLGACSSGGGHDDDDDDDHDHDDDD